MGVRHLLLVLALAMPGLYFSTSAASAIALSFLPWDTAPNSVLVNPALVAQGRINSITLHQNVESSTANQADFVWSNGEKQAFSLTYDSSTVSYKVGEKTLESQLGSPLQNIVIYAQAPDANTSLLLDSLQVQDALSAISISGIAATSTNGGRSLIAIDNIEGSFSLTGNVTLSWAEDLQSAANIAYQILGGTSTINASNPAEELNTSSLLREQTAPILVDTLVDESDPPILINQSSAPSLVSEMDVSIQVEDTKSPKTVLEPNTTIALLLSTGAIAVSTRRRANHLYRARRAKGAI
jgi:hypothetical protein